MTDNINHDHIKRLIFMFKTNELSIADFFWKVTIYIFYTVYRGFQYNLDIKKRQINT